MVSKLTILPRVERELEESYEWYEEQQQGLGLKLIAEFYHYLSVIFDEPLLCAIKRPPYREAVLKKFPYVIVYEVEDKGVVVHSFFNTYRNPDNKP